MKTAFFIGKKGDGERNLVCHLKVSGCGEKAHRDVVVKGLRGQNVEREEKKRTRKKQEKKKPLAGA